MSTEAVLLTFLLLYLAGFVFAPFPHWPTYRVLWRAVLGGSLPLATRRRQAWFLLTVGFWAPFRTFLWYLDELLYPDYRDREVRPVFIIGQPRCGTTLLHRTMAADSQNFFAIRCAEWRYPFIALQKLLRAIGLDGWLGRRSYWPATEDGRRAAKMHANLLSDWEEDGIFFEEIFLHHFFIFLRFPDPTLLPYLDGFPELPPRTRERILETHRRVIQKVQYLRGPEPRIYLSKEVTSHNKIPFLLHLYPQCRFIVITRKADDFMSSLQALMQTSTLVKTGVDPLRVAGWREAFVTRMRMNSRLLADLCCCIIPAQSQLRVSSVHFVNDIAGTIRSLYAQLRVELPEAAAVALEQTHRAANHRDRGYSYENIQTEGFAEYDAFVDSIVTATAPVAARDADVGRRHDRRL